MKICSETIMSVMFCVGVIGLAGCDKPAAQVSKKQAENTPALASKEHATQPVSFNTSFIGFTLGQIRDERFYDCETYESDATRITNCKKQTLPNIPGVEFASVSYGFARNQLADVLIQFDTSQVYKVRDFIHREFGMPNKGDEWHRDHQMIVLNPGNVLFRDEDLYWKSK